ncbi:MAG: KipI antagonist, partial [Candidatus Marinimicrobia bacterium]|nr:KipI antagonist [Candidatus Neomarinimicrobiota bacterium]
GDPIISFVEHQTTGGYPKIANVIMADLYKVGQLKPGDKIKFDLVTIEEAEELRFEQLAFINNLEKND